MLPLLNFFLKFIYRLQTYVSARFVASCNLLNLFGSSIAVGHVGKLLVVNLFCQPLEDRLDLLIHVAQKIKTEDLDSIEVYLDKALALV